MTQQLWHFHSETLKGFYASEVYAVDNNLAGAVIKALDAFDKWMEDNFHNYGCWPLIEDFFNMEGQARTQVEQVREAFKLEALSKFKVLGKAAIFTRS